MLMDCMCPVCLAPKISYRGTVDQIPIGICFSCDVIIADCPEPKVEFYEHTYVQGGKFGYNYSEHIETRHVHGISEKRRGNKLKQFDLVLELGAGAGNFQAYLQAEGITSAGIERSQAMRDIAKNAWNIDLFDSIEEFAEHFRYKKNYCIVMIEMLEHIANPKEFISRTIGLLTSRPNAFYFTTPNRDAIALLGLQWEQVKPPEHLVLYGRKGIEKLVADFKYSIVDVTYYHSVLLHWSIKKFGTRSRQKMPILWVVTSFLRVTDSFLCSILPSRFATGLEILAVSNAQ